MEGEVKFYNHKKGFGFIKADEDEKEYFVHYSGIEEDVRINDGDRVKFEKEEDQKGERAVKVSLVSGKTEDSEE